MAYGFNEPQESEAILIKNATIWTNENQGILSNTDILITNGKITKIGNDLKHKSALVIDGTWFYNCSIIPTSIKKYYFSIIWQLFDISLKIPLAFFFCCWFC